MSAISSALSATSAIPIPYTSTVQTTLVDEGFLSIVDHTLIVTKATVYGTLAGTYTVTDSQGVTTTSVAASATSTGWGPFVPLTTTFTPPPDCFKNWHAYSWNITNARSAYPTFYLPNGDRGDCFPKDFMLLEYIDPYYSPGICPSGYWLASTGVTTSTRSAGVVTIKKGDCCPSGFEKSPVTTLSECYSFIYGNPASPTGYSYPTTPVIYGTSRVDFYYVPISIITYSSGDVSTVRGSEASNGWVDVTSGGQVEGRGIIIEWESTDQVVLDWLSTQTMSNSTAGPKPVAKPVPSTNHGISAGAIAGIAIGAVAGLAFFILAVWLFLRRRKRSQPNNEHDSPEHVNSHAIITPEKGYYSGQPNSYASEPQELGSNDISRTISPETHPPYLSPSPRWTQGSSLGEKENCSEMSTGPNSPVVNVHGSQNSSPLLGELPPPQSSSEHGGGGGGGFSIEHAPAHSRPLERNHVPPNSGLPPVQEQYRPYRPANIVP